LELACDRGGRGRRRGRGPCVVSISSSIESDLSSACMHGNGNAWAIIFRQRQAMACTTYRRRWAHPIPCIHGNGSIASEACSPPLTCLRPSLHICPQLPPSSSLPIDRSIYYPSSSWFVLRYRPSRAATNSSRHR
jgi:hypothetical protein